MMIVASHVSRRFIAFMSYKWFVHSVFIAAHCFPAGERNEILFCFYQDTSNFSYHHFSVLQEQNKIFCCREKWKSCQIYMQVSERRSFSSNTQKFFEACIQILALFYPIKSYIKDRSHCTGDPFIL